MVDYMPMIHAERLLLSKYLDKLTPEQWTAATWCSKWNVHDLVAHMVAAGNITFGHFAGGFIKSGFKFNDTIEADVLLYNGGSSADVKARFDSILTSTKTPPGPKYVAFGEVMVHGEEIRRALGDRGDHPDAHLVALADAYKTTGAPLNGKRRVSGLKLRATDVEWTTGSGPEVTGDCMSLSLAMSGRKQVLDQLTGDGLETLRSRM